jgi:hypothetical protein
MATVDLAVPFQRLIERNLDKTPCGRCDHKLHKLKACSMEDYKVAGSVWENIPKPQRKAADSWLMKHADYVGTPTAAISVSDSSTKPLSAGMGGQSLGSGAQQTPAHRPVPPRNEIVFTAPKPPDTVSLPAGTWLTNTMVLGGGLIHPGPGAFPGTPSIASIVGSVDDYGGKCLGSMRLQNVHKTDREASQPQL